MSVSNVSNNTQYTAQTTNSNTNTDNKTDNTSNSSSSKESGVVYTPSNEDKVDKSKSTYKPDTKTIQMLKEDADRRTSQLRSLVEKMLNEQFGKASSIEDIFLRIQKGDFTVDEATAKKAAEEISEDGYWGVEKTSERMVSFAKALTGGDPSKIDSMISAFQKGYDAAIKIMGGKDKAPDITKRTYEATMEKFEAWKKESAVTGVN